MELTDVRTLRTLLEAHGLTARKGLGQHFLCSKPVVQRIVSRVVGFGGVLEIGPGPGVLTGPLSEVVEKVLALEVDHRMLEALRESSPKAEAVEGDALDVDLTLFLDALPTPRAVVSNLPYYITGPLLTRIAEARQGFDKAVLMMQKEVAVRVLAQAGNSDRGSLSVFLQLQFEIQKVAEVPPGAFWPPPKVDSMVLELIPKEEAFAPDEERGLFELVRAGFRQPRKTLANNLAHFGIERAAAARAISLVGLDLRCRPADPDLEQWVGLYRAVG